MITERQGHVSHRGPSAFLSTSTTAFRSAVSGVLLASNWRSLVVLFHTLRDAWQASLLGLSGLVATAGVSLTPAPQYREQQRRAHHRVVGLALSAQLLLAAVWRSFAALDYRPWETSTAALEALRERSSRVEPGALTHMLADFEHQFRRGGLDSSMLLRGVDRAALMHSSVSL